MKKFVGFMIAMVSFLIIGVENVWAGNASDYYYNVNAAAKMGAATMVCQYYDEERKDEYGVAVFYRFDTEQVQDDKDRWEIYYKLGGDWQAIDDHSFGNFSKVIERGKRIYFQSIGQGFTGGEANFTCPKYASIDNNLFHELCFSDGVSCGEKTMSTDFTNHGPYVLKETGETIFDVIKQYASKDVYTATFKTSLASQAINNKNAVKTEVIKATRDYITNKYSFGDKYKMPSWVSSYIDGLFENGYVDFSEEDYENLMTEVKNTANQLIEHQKDMGIITSEEATKAKENIENATSESYEEALGIKIDKNIKPNDCPDCNSLLGDDLTKIVKNLFTTIKFAGPVLVGVFTMLDFLKAVTVGSQEEIKKASNKFMKRVIAAILLFFVPILCEIMFGFAGITAPPLCLNEVVAEECK